MTSPGQDIAVGIDIGAASVKALAVDAGGRVLGRARVPHRLVVDGPDGLEHDPVEAWREGPRRALAELGPAGRAARAIGICAMVPSIVAIGADGRPLTRAPLSGDRRGRAAARPPHSTDQREGAALLRWAVDAAPDATGYWPAQAMAAAALGGEPALDDAAALAFFPVFDGAGWDPSKLNELGIEAERLPRVRSEPEPLPGGALLVPPSVDVAAEQVVYGPDEPGEALVACGTTLMTWATVEDGRDLPGLWTVPHARPGRRLAGGPSNAGGLFLDWARGLLAAPGRAAVPPDRVPVWLPYVRGERVPLHDERLRASLHDLDLTHGPAALRRAAYEAAAFAVRHQLDLAGCTPRRIVATGGGARDAEWLHALADCVGAPVAPAAVPEGAALGMAWTARAAAGGRGGPRGWARLGGRVKPDPRWTGACARRYARFRELQDVGQGRWGGAWPG